MAAIAFDPLEYTHQLEASGVPRNQAEVHAKTMTAMFLHNLDALVTKDYLDSRFNEFEMRLESRLDKRLDMRLAEFAAVIEKRFTAIDQRFTGIDNSFIGIDKRFAEIGRRFAEIDKRFAEIDKRFADIDVRFERIDGKFNLVYWMQGMTIACVVIPLIRGFLG